MTTFAQEKAILFLDGLLPLGTFPRTVSAITFTAIIWGIEGAFCYFVGLAVWDGMSVGTALLLLVVVNFASLLPFTIGGIGAIEVVTPIFLISSGISPYPALAMVLLQHAGQYVFTTIAGGIFYLTGGFYRIPLVHPKAAAPRRPAPATPSRVIEEARSSLGRLGASGNLKPPLRGDIQLSIVIPAYNEQARLPRTVLDTVRWCTTQKLDFELLIADDGSHDDTLALSCLFEESDARIRCLACPHMGKGAAVRMGMLNAKGRLVLFMDADGATPLKEIPKLVAAIEEGHDVAIGSRIVQHPGEVDIKTSLHRRVIGRIFALFVNLFAIEGIADTQCGFKMFRRAAAAAIFSRQKSVGFAFDVELLFIARRLSLSIAEIPVNWVAQPGSKVNLFTDSIKMLWDISRIRWAHRHSWSTLPPWARCLTCPVQRLREGKRDLCAATTGWLAELWLLRGSPAQCSRALGRRSLVPACSPGWHSSGLRLRRPRNISIPLQSAVLGWRLLSQMADRGQQGLRQSDLSDPIPTPLLRNGSAAPSYFLLAQSRPRSP